jgi:phenylacetate-CoA ligase
MVLQRKDVPYLWIQYKTRGSGVHSALRQLWATDRADMQTLSRIRNRKLQKLLEFVDNSVEYYRSLSLSVGNRQGFKEAPCDVLKDIPILEKEAVRTLGNKLIAAGKGWRSVSQTGGTTGTPIQVIHDANSFAWAAASLERCRMREAIAPSDWGLHINDFGEAPWLGRLRMRLGHRGLAPVFVGADRRAESEIVRQIMSGKYKFIEGYVSDLVALADRLPTSPRELRAVFVTGEMLYGNQRELLQRAFGCPIREYYGSNEVASIAAECEQGSLHVNVEHVHLEVIDGNGLPVWDKPGRIVVTDLDNRAMPLLRYAIGDEGTVTTEPCACGRAHTRIVELLGRSQDYVRNGAGDRLSGTFFAGFFRDLTAIGRFQLVQLNPSNIRVDYEGYGSSAFDEACRLRDEIRRRLGDQLRVDLCHVAKIERTLRGKTPLVRHITAEYDAVAKRGNL